MKNVCLFLRHPRSRELAKYILYCECSAHPADDYKNQTGDSENPTELQVASDSQESTEAQPSDYSSVRIEDPQKPNAISPSKMESRKHADHHCNLSHGEGLSDK